MDLLKRDCGTRLFAAYGLCGTIIYNRSAYVLVDIAFFRFANRKPRVSPTIHTNTNVPFVNYHIVSAWKKLPCHVHRICVVGDLTRLRSILKQQIYRTKKKKQWNNKKYINVSGYEFRKLLSDLYQKKYEIADLMIYASTKY